MGGPAAIRFEGGCGHARRRKMAANNTMRSMIRRILGLSAIEPPSRRRVKFPRRETFKGRSFLPVSSQIMPCFLREEVAGMTWAELSADFSTIPASRAKNGATHIVPLSATAQDLLRMARWFGELVFPGLRGPFNGWSKAKAALDAGSGVANWRLHDLRRTAATGLQRLGVHLEVTEQVLNDVSGSPAGIVGIYQRHDLHRRSAQRWMLGETTCPLLSRDARPRTTWSYCELEDFAPRTRARTIRARIGRRADKPRMHRSASLRSPRCSRDARDD